ncbi:MAG TPA: S9 family peptidase [Candidatus Acidoferrales bacterium]|nr:S9 family peptidase [Candidatus Acidoferrales bacterium]
MNREPRMSRRIFLRASTFAGAGAAIAGGLLPFSELNAESPSTRSALSAPQSAESSMPASIPKSLDEWIERIFASREFSARRFGPIRWEEGGKSYTVLEFKHDEEESQELASYDSTSGERTVLFSSQDLVPPGSKEPLRIDDFEWSSDRQKILVYTNSERVWRENTRGDYWVFDRRAKNLHKIGGDAASSTLMFAKFSPDGRSVGYVRENNLYVEQLDSKKITALTTDGSVTTISGTSDWVYEEEFDVRDGFRWGPDGRSIAYFQFDSSPVREFSMINDLGGGFRQPVMQIPYPKYGVYPQVWTFRIPSAGTPNSNVRIGVVNVSTAKTKWLDVTGDSEKSYLPRFQWVGDSNEILLQHINRAQNRNDVYVANASSGRAHRIFRDEDKAWIDVNDDTRFLKRHNGFLWMSERDGWRHAYVIPRNGSGPRLITRGDFDVIEMLQVDPDEQFVYFIASPENATQRYLYRASLDGSASPERLTPASQPGIHAYQLSPDCRWALHVFSNFETPPKTELISLPDHRTARVLADNSELLDKAKSLLDARAEFFQVDVGEGVKLDAYMIKPANFSPSKKYPLLINVYGEPAAQTVMDAWGGATMLFHRALANQGYLVASIDNRGTPAPKGREWRKIIYGAVGVLSSKEQAAAVQAIARERSYVDAERVAVWGWSGGGTNTLNLMFRSPEIYKVGMSVAPVPDQRIYDTIYQERYMGLPQENVEGYKSASAINHAEGLRGRLLLVHGSGDDNVHFAGSELLVNRMIDLGKPFDFMMYPNRTHSISEGPGTTLHLFKRLARHLTTYLPLRRDERTLTLLLDESSLQKA